MQPKLNPGWQLEQLLEAMLTSGRPEAQLRCLHGDTGPDGSVDRLGGLRRARECLLEAKKLGTAWPAILLFGLPSVDAFAARIPAEETELRRLWNWPGLVYLQYGFNKGMALDAAHRAVEGAKSPPDTDLLQSCADLLRLSAEVRHWLENRHRNVEGARRDFERAAQGKWGLDESYFEPVAAISTAHRAMLGRLWAKDISALRHAPRGGGLARLRATLDAFEQRWESLELARATLRDAEPSPAQLAAAADVYRQVSGSLSEAIDLTHALEHELSETQER